MVVAPSLNNDVTQSMMDSARVGLDYIVENADYIEKLSSALESKNFVVKKQVFELLSALCVYSTEGYGRTLQALEHFKTQSGERYRFKFVVVELRNSPTVEYQTAVLAFINCLILATPDLRERARVRSEFIGLRLLQVLVDLRHRNKDYTDLVVQLDVFDEQKESDEAQVSPTSNGIDLSSPLEVFDAILRQISDTPQEVPFLSILQHLLRIDSKEPISDLIWDAAERLVHRATLLESKDDALRILKAPSHAKSLHKLKGASNGERCTGCGCHKSDRKASVTVTIGDAAGMQSSPPCPPPPPVPPPPPGMPMPPPPPPPGLTPGGLTAPKKELPKLPQQSIPMPRAKMRTVNWNKIPSGQILEGDQNNIWATFAKRQNSKVALDWGTLEGLFCLQNEKSNLMPVNNNSLSRNGDSEKRGSKKETSEVTLLDAKRSLNINIFLKQFRSSNEDMIDLILHGASEDFGSERLRGLLKILPSKDEIEMLKSVPESDKSRLGSAEKFLLQLIQVDGYRLRLEAMLLKEELEACVNSIESSINAILQAAQDVKSSQEFQEVIFMILVAGNFLNSGGYAGDAAGVKLTSLQKIADIRGNKPGISLLNFISMQAEARNPKLISFANEMTALEDASKTSIDQLKADILSLKTKVTTVSQQIETPTAPKDIINHFGQLFQEATLQINSLESYLTQVDEVRVDLARFFCEDLHTFKLEDCFKILFTFTNKWKAAALENVRRKKQEEEAEARKKVREEQLKKRAQISWQNQSLAEDAILNVERNKGVALNPEDDIFIACSPRIVRRRLGSLSDNNAGTPGQPANDQQLTLPSPDITPNGSLRRRRSRVPSDEDETGLMDFLRTSGSSGSGTEESRERRGTEQYGSLDRSWSRKARRRPNLMDFVNDDRERPVSPAPPHPDLKGGSGGAGPKGDGSNTPTKHESPAREWRERITAWFVDLENGGSGEIPKRRPPPRRFQRRFGLETRGDSVSRGLATLPEGEASQEEENQQVTPYERVYPDRRPSLKLNTDVVSAMEAIEEVQSPVKEKSMWRRPSLVAPVPPESPKKPESPPVQTQKEDGRRSLIGSLGAQSQKDKLVLYIPEKSPIAGKTLTRSPSVREERSKGLESSHENVAAGTQEGFDRFSSIRRSRRYKKGPETPSPTSKEPLSKTTIAPKFVSKVDITGEHSSQPLEAKVVCTGNNETTPSRANSRLPLSKSTTRRQDPRSASMIEPRHVLMALGRNTPSTETAEPSSNGSAAVGITRPVFAVSGGTRDPSHHPFNSSKGILSSSPGSTERDEGFEESQSSLSETNSQTDTNVLPGLHRSGSNRLQHSFRGSNHGLESTRPTRLNLNTSSSNTISVPSNPIRKKSFQENSPIESNGLNHNNNNNTNSSRTSLQSSRSSLTSQSTVREVAEPKAKTPTTPNKDLSTHPLSFSSLSNHRKPLSSTLSSNVANNRQVLNNRNVKNESIMAPSTPGKGSEKEKSSKSLAPRILSFMRPTASSSAKDKLDPPKVKGLTHKKSFK